MSIKTILTIGTGYSGSSAIYEYLQNTGFYFDPFPNKEFSLVYDPGGIIDLEILSSENFTLNKNAFIINQFKKNIDYYTHSYACTKKNKEVDITKNILKNYLNSIIYLEYTARTNFIKYNDSFLKKIIEKVFYKVKLKFKNNKIPIIVNSEEFKKNTKKLFKDLFKNNLEEKDIIIDQGANIYNLKNSIKYYTNPHCILVFRDPRDIFSEFKKKTASAYPKENVELFCLWYDRTMSQILNSDFNDVKLIKIKFEDFILKNELVINKLSNFLNKEIMPNSNKFNFLKSKKNILRFRNDLLKTEVDFIENKLKKYLNKIYE